jgi:DNA (cytosine-5)-methyltransferase 1
MPTFYEFFAGGGMARQGLGAGWDCAYANDFDEMKAATYAANWAHRLDCRDVALVRPKDIPGAADLAWASFPCQDLSLAGDKRGMGQHGDPLSTRSGTFWPFWHLMKALAKQGRAPSVVVLENVPGTITSRGGQDFAAIAAALADGGYAFGAVVIDAKRFVPQSRARLFVVGVRTGLLLPAQLVADSSSKTWHPASLIAAQAALPKRIRDKWVWWNLPLPKKRTKVFSDIIESRPTGVRWDSQEDTERLLSLMSEVNLAKVREAQKAGRRVVGSLYRRTRVHNGIKAQRAEVRFDEVAGCLRTPRGGSSRQRILVVEGRQVRSRLLSPREAARLMSLPDRYKLPPNYNDAYHVAGEASWRR